ncbi:MAG: hypothetical protein U5L72_03695 [Bacteroidales bacterium]|nr:hypothetical protein [Bacteroidales bacterium]
MIKEYYRFRSILFGFAMVLMLLISSCSPSDDQKEPVEPKTILYAEFMHEVNSFSPHHHHGD